MRALVPLLPVLSLLALSAGLPACQTAKIALDDSGVIDSTGDSAGGDTDTDTDTDSDTDSDTDTDTVPSMGDISWVPTGDGADGSGVGLYLIASDFSMASTSPSATADFDGTRWPVTFTPPSADITDTGLSRFAIYVCIAQGSDSAPIGVSEWLAFYVDGDPGSDLASYGLSAGWNGVEVTGQSSAPIVISPVDLKLGFNLINTNSVSIAGTWTGTVSTKDRLAVYPYTGTGDMLYEGTLPAAWSLTLTGRPVDTAISSTSGLELGGGTPFAYQDNDSSHTVSSADSELALGVLDSGESVGLVWVDPVTDVNAAYTLTIGVGGHVGWGAYAQTDGQRLRELTAGEAAAVRLVPSTSTTPH